MGSHHHTSPGRLTQHRPSAGRWGGLAQQKAFPGWTWEGFWWCVARLFGGQRCGGSADGGSWVGVTAGGGTDGVTITTLVSRQAAPLYRSHRKLQPLVPD